MTNVHTDATSESIIVSIDFFLFIAERMVLTCTIMSTSMSISQSSSNSSIFFPLFFVVCDVDQKLMEKLNIPWK